MSDEDSADEMEDDCKLMNGDVSIVRWCGAWCGHKKLKKSR